MNSTGKFWGEKRNSEGEAHYEDSHAERSQLPAGKARE